MPSLPQSITQLLVSASMLLLAKVFVLFTSSMASARSHDPPLVFP